MSNPDRVGQRPSSYNSGTDTTSVENHLKYDAFGRITSETDASETPRQSYTGRELDEVTGLYYYRARYYDAVNGRFIGEDPLSFSAGDANLRRYVGNSPTNGTDPSGMVVIDNTPKTPNSPFRYSLTAMVS